MEIKSQMKGGVNFTILQYLGLTLAKDDILYANNKQMTICEEIPRSAGAAH